MEDLLAVLPKIKVYCTRHFNLRSEGYHVIGHSRGGKLAAMLFGFSRMQGDGYKTRGLGELTENTMTCIRGLSNSHKPANSYGCFPL